MSRISTSNLLAAIGVATLIAAPMALAQDYDTDDSDARMCRNGLFAADPPFQLARIVGEGRAYLLEDVAPCPEEGACRKSAYLLPGDQVIVSKLRAGHACAYYPNDSGGSAGYVPLPRLQALPVDTTPPVSAWLGQWSDYGNPDLSITQRDGSIHVEGLAFWPGPDGSVRHPFPNTGELDGPIAIHGNRARYDDGFCTVDFTLLDGVLLAHDNFRCGGMNVRFTSVYARSDGPPAELQSED